MQAMLVLRFQDELQAYHPETYYHSRAVLTYSLRIGECLGLPEEMREDLETAAVLHDIGKLIMPLEILNETGKLTDMQYAIIKQHTLYGYNLLHLTGFNQNICEAVRDHHERCDGCGYNKRTEFSLIAKIICVADAFDAMKSDRPYSSALSPREIRDELMSNAGTQFDKEISALACRFLEGDS